MNQRLGMAEFFAMEAAEYLERLDALVSAPGVPNGEEFQRLTRALRGAALMANQQPIAQASGALEQVARAVRDGNRSWDEATRQLATRAVDDLKIFVRKVRNWTDADTQKARDLAASLEAITGRPSRPMRAPQAGPDSGTRAFVAREGAAVASALDRAAKTLAHQPAAPDMLQSILNVMQPLRGLAGLADLPPMADLLEAVELAVAEVGREPGSPNAPEVFESAAHALSQSTREIASEGRADPETDAVRRFGSLLGTLLQLDQVVPPIDSLFHDDAGPHVVEHGTTPTPAVPLGELDLVSHGEHLRQVADSLDAASGPTQRRLRAYALAETLRVLERGGEGPLVTAAAAFALGVRDAIGGGTALEDPAGFAGHLRAAGAVLAAAANQPADDLGHQLREVTAALTGAPMETAPPSDLPDIAAFAPDEPAVEPPPSVVAPEPEPVVAPEPEPVAEAPSASAPPHTPTSSEEVRREGPGLAGSLLRFHRYQQALDLEGGSLDELLAGPPADPGAPPAAAPAPHEDLVPITSLCYSGASALDRALSLREQVRETLASGQDVSALIEEVFDLVKLSVTAA